MPSQSTMVDTSIKLTYHPLWCHLPFGHLATSSQIPVPTVYNSTLAPIIIAYVSFEVDPDKRL